MFLLQVAGRSWTQHQGGLELIFDSFLRDEICAERASRNIDQHASGMSWRIHGLDSTLCPLQSFVSLRRIERYLHSAEVAPVPPLDENSPPIAFHGATVTWPQDRARSGSSSASTMSSASTTPKTKFMLTDLNIVFPKGELSLICGKLGSGKTLLLLALLGETDLLTGQVLCPKTPPDAIASFAGVIPPPGEWVVDGVCAYVPQSAWLRNASIKENILFNLPYVEERYQRTLEVCALVNDLKILEDSDESEIGERGVNLSGGQKARVSLARAVYSRASILLLDDVLSAVDAHTAHALYFECLKGDLMRGRTVILVSHHVQLCAPGASYIVALENGRILYKGDRHGFQSSGVINNLAHSGAVESTGKDETEDVVRETTEEFLVVEKDEGRGSSSSSSEIPSEGGPIGGVSPIKVNSTHAKKGPRKLVEEETRAVGRVDRSVWDAYVKACGGISYWLVFLVLFLLAAVSPVAENGWLSYWSGAAFSDRKPRSPMYYIGIYAAITGIGLVLTTIRWYILCSYRRSIPICIILTAY